MQTTPDTTSTSTTVEGTIDRYVVLFNEPDGATRTELAHAIWADDGTLVDPLVDATGPEAVATAIGALQEQMPGHALTRTTGVDAHHTYARFGWAVTGPDGAVALAGIDVVTFTADGRIQSAIGFFGEAPPPES